MISKSLFVLAGGFGTRLKSVVSEVPKPLAPVNDHPFLYYQINNWYSQGITTFYFLLHHQSEMIIDYFNSLKRENKYQNCTFNFLIEKEPLGTGGSILNAIRYYNLKGDILITNADTWLESGICELSESKYNCIAVVEEKNTNRFGTIEFNNENLIINFHEKTGINKSGFINAGLYKLNVDLFESIPLYAFSIETYLFPELVKNKQINAKIINTTFIDIGVPEDYYKFCSLNK